MCLSCSAPCSSYDGLCFSCYNYKHGSYDLKISLSHDEYNNLLSLASSLGCLAERGKNAGLPSVANLLKKIAHGLVVVECTSQL